MIKLLTETEVAEFLGCSRLKIKRLRLTGKLPYIPGAPVTIDEADLAAYVENEKRLAEGPDEETKAKLAFDKAVKRARWIWFQRRFIRNDRRGK